jgi:hypothetical protein
MGSEQREWTRVPAHLWGIVGDADTDEQVFEVEQLSLRGGHAVTEQRLPQGSELSLRLTNDLSPGALVIVVHAVVRNHSATGMGLEFTAMPLESYGHLQRLVELHADDPDRVVHEIHEHVGLKRRPADGRAA